MNITFRWRPLCFIAGVALIYILWSYNSSLPSENYMTSKGTINLKVLLIHAVEIAKMGGDEVRDVITNNNMKGQSKGKTNEGANDPVTNADLKSHCVMFYNMVNSFPLVPIISEEKPSDNICNQSKLTYNTSKMNENVNQLPNKYVPVEDINIWIDPLDATQEYTEHLLQYVTIMICVAVKGVPTIGVIHRPFQNDHSTVWAWLNTGISDNLKELNNHRRSFGMNDHPNDPKVIVSRSHAGKIKQIVTDAFGPKAEVISAGGAGYKVLEVVNGNAHVYVHSTAIKKWDICAGDAILRSVGGRMSTLKNADIIYDTKQYVNDNGIIATVSNHRWFYKKFKKIYN